MSINRAGPKWITLRVPYPKPEGVTPDELAATVNGVSIQLMEMAAKETDSHQRKKLDQAGRLIGELGKAVWQAGQSE